MKIFVPLLFCLLGLSTLTSGANTTVDSYTLVDTLGISPYDTHQRKESAHFIALYPKDLEAFATRALTEFEHAHQVLAPLMRWEPRGKTQFLVTDNLDAANGLASPALRIGVILYATPPESWFSTAHTEDWIKTLVWHEYLHVLNIDPTRDFMEVLRWVFGDVVRPNGLQPRWLLEGLAVYFETRTMPSTGRGRSPYWEGILRAITLEKKWDHRFTLDRVNGSIPYFPAGEMPYLFGYHLTKELSLQATERGQNPFSKLADISIASSGRIPYFLEGNLIEQFGKSWADLWRDFVARTEADKKEEIETIKRGLHSAFTPLTQSQGEVFISALAQDESFLITSENGLNERVSLKKIDLKTKTQTVLDEKRFGVGAALTPRHNWVVYSALDNVKSFNTYSELFAIRNDGTGRHRLTEQARAKDPALSPDGKLIVYTVAAQAEHQLWMAEVDTDAQAITLKNPRLLQRPAPFGAYAQPQFLSAREIIVSHQMPGKRGAQIESLSLPQTPQEKITKTIWIDNGAHNRFPQVYPAQSDSITFVSDASGVQNIYSLKRGKTPVRLTNVITGIVNAIPSKKSERSYASRISAKGIEAVEIAHQTHADDRVVKIPNNESSIPESLNTPPAVQVTNPKEEPFFSGLAPRQWAPWGSYSSVAGTEAGALITGFNRNMRFQYLALGSYNFKTERPDGLAEVLWITDHSRFTLGFEADTRFFSSSLFERKFQATLKYSMPLRTMFSTWIPSVEISGRRYRGYGTSTDAVSASFLESEWYQRGIIPTVTTSLFASHARKSPLGFMPEFGASALLAHEASQLYSYRTLHRMYLHAQSFHHLGNHWVFSPRFRGLHSTRLIPGAIDTYAQAQGRNSASPFSLGTGTSLDSIGIRGYSDRGFLGRWVAVPELDLHFPLAQLFSGFETTPAFIEQLHGFVFIESALLQGRSKIVALPSTGLGIVADGAVLLYVPVSVSLQIHRGLNGGRGADTSVFIGLHSPGIL